MDHHEIVTRLAQHPARGMMTVSLALVSGTVDQEQQLVRQIARFAKSGSIAQSHDPATLVLPISLDLVEQRVLGKPRQFGRGA
jgi:hypothetical protein